MSDSYPLTLHQNGCSNDLRFLCHEHPLIYQGVTAAMLAFLFWTGFFSRGRWALVPSPFQVDRFLFNEHTLLIYIYVIYICIYVLNVCRSPTYSDLATRAVSLLSQIWPKSEALIKLLSYFLWFWPPDLALFVGYVYSKCQSNRCFFALQWICMYEHHPEFGETQFSCSEP